MIKNNSKIITTFETIRNIFNIPEVKRIFSIGSDIFIAIQPFLEKRTPLNAVKATFLVGKAIVDNSEIWPDEYFDDSWDSPYSESFNKLILNVLNCYPRKVIKTSNELKKIHILTINTGTNNITLGYIFDIKLNKIAGDERAKLYIKSDNIENAKNFIKTELWKTMKNKNIVLRHVRHVKDYDDMSISLDADDTFCSMHSKRAHEYSLYLKKCIDAGVPRAVLLYGPPGTGKSTMARTIVDNLKMKSFRIRVEDIIKLESSTIFETISIFEPDAIILDDFDRSGNQEGLLEILEYFQRHVKLVIATVNNKNRLDNAILRPGRFDEFVQVKQMDDDVVKAVLGVDNIDAFDVVKEWPIAFIQEYVKRRRFMSPEEATSSIKELADRVNIISKYDNDDDKLSLNKILRDLPFERGDNDDKNNHNDVWLDVDRFSAIDPIKVIKNKQKNKQKRK